MCHNVQNIRHYFDIAPDIISKQDSNISLTKPADIHSSDNISVDNGT